MHTRQGCGPSSRWYDIRYGTQDTNTANAFQREKPLEILAIAICFRKQHR